MDMPPHAGFGLARLEARLREDLAWLELPARPWIPRRVLDGEAVLDVAIVGGGMCGLAAAWAMKRLGIDSVVFDRAPAGSEGPWTTFGRMETLRSPKQLVGPALGLPSLTFRAYYEAQFGPAAWDALGKIPRTQWMDYLVWFRQVLGLPVENGQTLVDVQPGDGGTVAITVEHLGVRRTVRTRRLVLATGRDGLGGPWTPPDLNDGLDRSLWAHSADPIDFEALRGKRVGVVGAGASAVDNAATALEAGARSVDLFVRRTDIPRINKLTGIGSQGFVHGFGRLPDLWKWRFLHYALSAQTPPPRDSVLRFTRDPNARVHTGSPIRSVAATGAGLLVDTPKGRVALDFLIFATGFRTDLALRPELAALSGHIRRWNDRFAPPPELASEELATAPDLGPAFQFQEREPGACPTVSRVHCFNYAATLSHGKLSGDIPAVGEGADRLARGIAANLFAEDREIHFANLQAYDTPELLGDEWTDADAADAPTKSCA